MTCLEIVRCEPFGRWRRLLIARSGIGGQRFRCTSAPIISHAGALKSPRHGAAVLAEAEVDEPATSATSAPPP